MSRGSPLTKTASISAMVSHDEQRPAAITRAAGIRLRPVFIVELLSQVFAPETRTGRAAVKGGKSLRNRAVSLESSGTALTFLGSS
jgi:hypothetical protein